MAAKGYRLLAIWGLVAGVLLLFLSFFFVFLTAPLVPLGLFYFVFLFSRGRATRRERRSALLEHEADERQRLLDRDLGLPTGVRT